MYRVEPRLFRKDSVVVTEYGRHMQSLPCRPTKYAIQECTISGFTCPPSDALPEVVFVMELSEQSGQPSVCPNKCQVPATCQNAGLGEGPCPLGAYLYTEAGPLVARKSLANFGSRYGHHIDTAKLIVITAAA
jgi:hypothetical protein